MRRLQREIVAALGRHGEMRAFDLRDELERAMGGRVGVGSLYHAIDLLEAAGIVRSRLAPGSRERGGRPNRMVALAGGRRLRDRAVPFSGLAAAAIVVLIALALAGCAPPDAPARAVFVVQMRDLYDAPRPGIVDADIAVCNPALDPAEVATTLGCREQFAYTSAAAVALSGPNQAYFQRLRETMLRPEWVQADDAGDAVPWPWAASPLRFKPEAFDSLAHFLAREHAGWTGIYIDLCWQDLPLWYLSRLGPPATWDAREAAWDTCRDGLLLQLRLLMPDALIIANTALPAVTSPYLDGVTIEVGHVDSEQDVYDALLAFDWYRRTRGARNRCIAWGWPEASTFRGSAAAGVVLPEEWTFPAGQE